MCLFVSTYAGASDKFNAQKRYLYIQPGQSVFSIVKVIYPDEKPRWSKIIKKIVKINPHAFSHSDPLKIKVGERIELPNISLIKTTQKKHAHLFKQKQTVGQVIKKRGKAFVISKKNKQRKLDIGSEIYVGDRIFTGVTGYIRLNMIDQAKIDLRCNSEMLIEEYRLLRGGNRSVIYLIKGSVKKITGTIGKMADDLYEMHTPLATVGVRGTEYAIRVLQQHGCDGSLDVNSKGLFVKVNRGEIDVKNKKESRVLKQNEAMYLADKNGQLKKIEAREGLFDRVEEDKTYFFGSLFWLLGLFPVICVLRKSA